MADLTTSDVTIIKSWENGDRQGKLVSVTVQARITSGTAGGTSNKIVPAAFGLDEFISCSNLSDYDNRLVYPAAVDIQLGIIIIADAAAADASTHVEPNDLAFENRNSTIVVTGVRYL